MTTCDHCTERLRDTGSSRAMRHALGVLAQATGATVVLFDHQGRVLLEPVTGNEFIRRVLGTPAGLGAVIEVHRRAALGQASDPPAETIFEDGLLEHLVIPFGRDNPCAGLLTMGTRPRTPLTPDQVRRVEELTGLAPGTLSEPGVELWPWTEERASAARNMAALVAELFADLCVQEENLRQRIEELTAVYNIAGLFAGTTDLKAILERTTAIVCDVMRVKACSVRLLDEASGNLVIRAVHNLSREYLTKGPVNVSENPIDSAAMNGETVHILDAPTDPRTRYPEQARAEGIVSGLVCGLIYRGKAVGVLRVYTGAPHEFTPFEEALLSAVAAQAAAAIVNAQLVAEALETERFARQLEYAGAVQRRMVPAEPPAHPNAEIGAVYRPTYHVGGDFYDFVELGRDNLGIAIADVSGKGVPASLLMASLRSALRVFAYFTYDIDRIMAGVNVHVCRETIIGEFATAFYGVLSPDARRFTYCNAGHDPPFLLRDGEIQRLGTGGMVLGVDANTMFEREVLELRPGDALLFYTDGAVEAMNFNDESFGRDRLATSFARYADQPAPLIVKNILWDIRRFRGLADRTDDLSLVAVKIAPQRNVQPGR